jgi:hypothetical protein
MQSSVPLILTSDFQAVQEQSAPLQSLVVPLVRESLSPGKVGIVRLCVLKGLTLFSPYKT